MNRGKDDEIACPPVKNLKVCLSWRGCEWVWLQPQRLLVLFGDQLFLGQTSPDAAVSRWQEAPVVLMGYVLSFLLSSLSEYRFR